MPDPHQVEPLPYHVPAAGAGGVRVVAVSAALAGCFSFLQHARVLVPGSFPWFTLRGAPLTRAVGTLLPIGHLAAALLLIAAAVAALWRPVHARRLLRIALLSWIVLLSLKCVLYLHVFAIRLAKSGYAELGELLGIGEVIGRIGGEAVLPLLLYWLAKRGSG